MENENENSKENLDLLPSSLQSLDLSYTNISNFDDLIHLLKPCTKLTELHLEVK